LFIIILGGIIINITIFAISKDKAKFFIRVANSFKCKHDITFLTTRYSSYGIIKRSGYKVHMLQEFIKDDVNINEFKSYESEAILMDVKTGLLSENRAKEQFKWLIKGFKNYLTVRKIDKLILWNGSMLQGFSASLVADKYNIKKIFFEVGNFPNKIFLDEKGVNAKSSLMGKDLTVCKNYHEGVIINFLEEHKKKKEGAHIVLQSIKNTKPPLEFIQNRLYLLFARYPIIESNGALLNILKQRFFSRQHMNYDAYDFFNKRYILFPLQVSVDSQVIRNSDISIYEALDIAHKEALNNQCDLVIKPHPAEKNDSLIKYINSMKSKNENIYFVKDNTYLLIKHAFKLLTINSTVGIEAMMYYKPVKVLGKSFYQPYCSENEEGVCKQRINKFLFNYIFNILKDASFFDNSTIDSEILKDYL
jgi:capsular polysaccharide export protein